MYSKNVQVPRFWFHNLETIYCLLPECCVYVLSSGLCQEERFGGRDRGPAPFLEECPPAEPSNQKVSKALTIAEFAASFTCTDNDHSPRRREFSEIAIISEI